MKKITILVCIILLMLSFTACQSSKLAASFDEEKVIARAKQAVEVINTLDYEAMCAEIREDLQPQLSADSLKKAWDATLTAAGKFKEYKTVTTMGTKDQKSGEDYAVVMLVCTYEKSTLTYTISLDTDLKVVGMYMK